MHGMLVTQTDFNLLVLEWTKNWYTIGVILTEPVSYWLDACFTACCYVLIHLHTPLCKYYRSILLYVAGCAPERHLVYRTMTVKIVKQIEEPAHTTDWAGHAECTMATDRILMLFTIQR
jgi:hypothetical protein